MIKKANNVKNDLKLVLASASPRREEILEQLNLKFTIVPSKIDEDNFTNSDPVACQNSCRRKSKISV